jgi:hypothetical protein
MKKIVPKKMSSPKWKKRRGDLAYDIIDPVSGGRWVIAPTHEMTDAELNAYVSWLLSFCGVSRPQRGLTSVFETSGA